MSGAVVTGIGVMAGAAHNFAGFVDLLFAASPIFPMNPNRLRDFDPARLLGRQGLTYLDECSRMALCVAAEALSSSRIDMRNVRDRGRLAVVTSTNLGVLQTVHRAAATIRRDGSRALRPIDLPNASPNVASSHVAIRYGLQGGNVTVAAGFASGLVALLQGEYLLRSDRADVVLVVGVEQMSPEARVLLDAALTRDAECVVVLGDGAAAVVLERDDDAAARGAVIRAKILGSGTCQGDGYDDAPFLAEAIMECLAEAELDPADLSLVLSADCGLGAFRVPEGRALSNSLDRSGGVPRAAPKSRLGETYGAAGVLQLIAAIACIERGGIFVSPASWRDCAEVEAAVPLVVTQRRADVRSALTLAWGPREQCVAIAVGAP